MYIVQSENLQILQIACVVHDKHGEMSMDWMDMDWRTRKSWVGKLLVPRKVVTDRLKPDYTGRAGGYGSAD